MGFLLVQSLFKQTRQQNTFNCFSNWMTTIHYEK